MSVATGPEVRQMQGMLYRHVAAAGLVSLGAGLALHLSAWGYAAALGFLATGIYYWMLGRQVTRTLAFGQRPALVQVVLLMLGRQGICMLACLVSLLAWGTPWWACLAALFVGRHWVMVAAYRRNT